MRIEVAWQVLRGRPAIYRVWFAEEAVLLNEHPDLLGTKVRGVRIGVAKEPDVTPSGLVEITST